MDVPVPQIKEEIVEIVAGEVVCNACTGVRRQHGWTCTYIELIVDVPVPRIYEQILDVIKVIVDVPVPHIPKQIVEVILGVVVRLQRHERQHGWTCPQSPEQIVEVIKVILQEQCQRMRFFF